MIQAAVIPKQGAHTNIVDTRQLVQWNRVKQINDNGATTVKCHIRSPRRHRSERWRRSRRWRQSNPRDIVGVVHGVGDDPGGDAVRVRRQKYRDDAVGTMVCP